jgi:hypothetical protein
VEEMVILSFRIARTIHGAEVKLYSDVLERMVRKHGELRGCEHMILETVERPDYIIKGRKRELLAIKHYTETSIGPKDMIVVYREDKELIITAFLTSKAHKLLRRRLIIWQKAR